jgi:hypothetical protein
MLGNLRINRPGGNQMLGADQFRRFGKDHRAAGVDELIARNAQGGICGNPGAGVRTPTVPSSRRYPMNSIRCPSLLVLSYVIQRKIDSFIIHFI